MINSRAKTAYLCCFMRPLSSVCITSLERSLHTSTSCTHFVHELPILSVALSPLCSKTQPESLDLLAPQFLMKEDLEMG